MDISWRLIYVIDLMFLRGDTQQQCVPGCMFSYMKKSVWYYEVCACNNLKKTWFWYSDGFKHAGTFLKHYIFMKSCFLIWDRVEILFDLSSFIYDRVTQGLINCRDMFIGWQVWLHQVFSCRVKIANSVIFYSYQSQWSGKEFPLVFVCS